MELYKVYRPKDLDAVVGQPTAVSVLSKMVENNEVPQALLFTGLSGTGKTTLARILRKYLKCHPQEFTEVNCADIRGIENIRDIRKRMNLRPMHGKSKIWLIDEAHKLTNDAQNALLKMLEDTPKQVWFFLCTTDPQKLIRTIRTRCTEIALKPIGAKDLQSLLVSVADKEDKKLSPEVIDKIVENSEGSARKALVLLGSILRLKTEEDMLEAIEKSTHEAQGIQLCRLLMNRRTQWPEVAKLLKELEGEDAEGLRRMVLGYMRSVMLGKGDRARAYCILCSFERSFFDSGNAGLAMACWEALSGGK